MLYQLPNGRVIEMSTEQYFEMSDEDLEYLVAYNYGDLLENPWFGSVLSKQPKSTPEDDVVEIRDISEIPSIERLSDLDVEFEED